MSKSTPKQAGEYFYKLVYRAGKAELEQIEKELEILRMEVEIHRDETNILLEKLKNEEV